MFSFLTKQGVIFAKQGTILDHICARMRTNAHELARESAKNDRFRQENTPFWQLLRYSLLPSLYTGLQGGTKRAGKRVELAAAGRYLAADAGRLSLNGMLAVRYSACLSRLGPII